VINFESCTILVVGRELAMREQDGIVVYEASEEMQRRADEAGMFYHTNAARIGSVVCTGGFPGAALGMDKPPEGVNEGTFLRNILVDEWNVPIGLMRVEGESGNTFDNFWECIKRGYLLPGQFDPQHPLVLSTNTPHAFRLGMLATSTLGLPADSLYRLRPGSVEGAWYYEKELRLAKATQLAIELADLEPGHPDFVKDVQLNFRSLWIDGGQERREQVLTAFDNARGKDWLPPYIPILDYPVLAGPPGR